MKYEMVRFGDYFSLQKGISYTSKNLVQDSETGLLTINAFIMGGGYKQSSEKPYDGDLKEQFLLSDGDVLVAMTEQDSGLLASPLVVNIDHTEYSQLTFSLDVARVLSRGNGIDPRFVFNVLRIPAFRRRAAYGDTGSTVQRLPYEALSDALIPKPSMQIQEAIVGIFDSFDEKIRINQQISKTLEAIAQTIFKSWFVDFDPVHAKSRGEQPVGMDEETAALFPDSFEESELGPIPTGWEIKPLSEVASLIKEVIKSGPETLKLPYVPVDKIDTKNIFLTQTAPSEAAKTSLLKFKKGDVLFGAMRPYFHKVCITPFEGVTRTTTFVLRPLTHRFFTLFTLFQDSTVEYATAHSQGSTIPYAVWDNGLGDYRVTHPSNSVLNSFEKLIEPLFAYGESVLSQNTKLTEIRDMLLPRLISGELEIPDELLVS